MSAIAYFEPLTNVGVSLSRGTPLDLHIHECGTMLLDSGWNYQDVCSPFWRAYYNLAEGASLRVGGVSYKLKPRQLLILPEGVKYNCIPKSGVRHIWVHYSIRGLPLQPPDPTNILLTVEEQKLWVNLGVEIAQGKPWDEYRLRQKCAGLLSLALRNMRIMSFPSGHHGLESLLSWMEHSLSQPLGLKIMAKRAGMSPRTFLNWFKAGTSVTPMAYLRGRRVREACRRLRFTGESIEKISEETGFANRYHFSRVFRVQTGCSPAEYRKQG